MEQEDKIMPMVDFILGIDAMTTNEFCETFKVPKPYFTGEINTSVDKFLQIDAIKHKMFVEHAKKLRKSQSSK